MIMFRKKLPKYPSSEYFGEIYINFVLPKKQVKIIDRISFEMTKILGIRNQIIPSYKLKIMHAD